MLHDGNLKKFHRLRALSLEHKQRPSDHRIDQPAAACCVCVVLFVVFCVMCFVCVVMSKTKHRFRTFFFFLIFIQIFFNGTNWNPERNFLFRCFMFYRFTHFRLLATSFVLRLISAELQLQLFQFLDSIPLNYNKTNPI